MTWCLPPKSHEYHRVSVSHFGKCWATRWCSTPISHDPLLSSALRFGGYRGILGDIYWQWIFAWWLSSLSIVGPGQLGLFKLLPWAQLTGPEQTTDPRRAHRILARESVIRMHQQLVLPLRDWRSMNLRSWKGPCAQKCKESLSQENESWVASQGEIKTGMRKKCLCLTALWAWLPGRPGACCLFCLG